MHITMKLTLALCLPLAIQSFSVAPRSHLRVNALRVATNPLEEAGETKASTSPSVTFGQPIDDATRQRTKQVVHAAKSYLFDALFKGENVQRYYARFYALETIARMPYFSYLSVLHLRETLGQWREAELLQVHFAENWNELHHLLIMEELGGHDRWWDRCIAQHLACFYYAFVIVLYLSNPTLAYCWNEMVEEEAYGTYDKFLNANAEYLKSMPAPQTALKYYKGSNLYMFDAMHHDDTERRPPCENLYDTFVNIRDDELEHVKTMVHLQK